MPAREDVVVGAAGFCQTPGRRRVSAWEEVTHRCVKMRLACVVGSHHERGRMSTDVGVGRESSPTESYQAQGRRPVGVAGSRLEWGRMMPVDSSVSCIVASHRHGLLQSSTHNPFQLGPVRQLVPSSSTPCQVWCSKRVTETNGVQSDASDF